MNPFEFVNDITIKKEYIMDKKSERFYVPFLTNKALGHHLDTILIANEMNKFHFLENRIQFDFLYHLTPKRKRFSKWQKKKQSKKIDIIKEYYNCSYKKAVEIEDLISKDDVKQMEKRLSKGGLDN